jgi:hypothetical protein
MLKALIFILASCCFTWFVVSWFRLQRECDIIAFQLQELKEMEDENI